MAADEKPETPHIPNPLELAELLLHQLQNLDPDGVPALMVTLRLADGTYIGDAHLSLPAEDGLVDAVISFSNYLDCTEQPAGPLLRDEDDRDPWPPLSPGDITDQLVDDLAAEFEEYLKSEGGQD